MAHKYSEQELKRIENSRALHYGYKVHNIPRQA